MKIYLSGGSGLGKTTLANRICDNYNIEYAGSITRNIFKDDPKFFDKPFEYRQAILLDKALEFHYSELYRVINDRSYLDYFVWTNKVLRRPSFPKGLPIDLFNEEDIVIVVPTPSLEWYRNNIDHFWTDELRKTAYTEASGLKIDTPYELAEVLHSITIELESTIYDLVSQVHPNVDKIIYPKLTDNYFEWSDYSFNEVGRMLNEQS